MEINDIMWEAGKDQWKATVNALCKKYETDPNYKLIKYEEGGEVVGFVVCHDISCTVGVVRILDAAYNLGKNRREFAKLWKKATKGAAIMRTTVSLTNTRMILFYKRMGFTPIDANDATVLFEKRS